jgi:hypothetical protein
MPGSGGRGLRNESPGSLPEEYRKTPAGDLRAISGPSQDPLRRLLEELRKFSGINGKILLQNDLKIC